MPNIGDSHCLSPLIVHWLWPAQTSDKPEDDEPGEHAGHGFPRTNVIHSPCIMALTDIEPPYRVFK